MVATPVVDLTSSTPTFQQFDPTQIAWQETFLSDAFNHYDYGQGVHQVLLSGSVGSAKSIVVAHLAIRHCLQWPGACFLIGRQKLPDLKKTLYKKIQQHGRDVKHLAHFRDTDAYIKFKNGSEIIGYSWHEADWQSFGSLELSGFAIEEAVENTGKYREAYFRLLTRVGRLPHVPQQIAIALTNPDEPEHWIYDHFDLASDEGLDEPPVTRASDPTKHVYYSLTEQNKFLPATYIETLMKNLDPREAERLLKGRWISRAGGRIYHGYEKARNFRDEEYRLRADLPLRLGFDFNIGQGKPFSSVAFQYDPAQETFHFFDQVVVEGTRTQEAVEEWSDRGYFKSNRPVIVHGDATGSSRDTRSKLSDYDIIIKRIASENRNVHLQVTKANPPIRKRQNLVNTYCLNALGQSRCFVYKKASTLDKGLRLTKLKKGSDYQEDDSDPWQHVVTACGYGIYQTLLYFARANKTHYP